MELHGCELTHVDVLRLGFLNQVGKLSTASRVSYRCLCDTINFVNSSSPVTHRILDISVWLDRIHPSL